MTNAIPTIPVPVTTAPDPTLRRTARKTAFWYDAFILGPEVSYEHDPAGRLCAPGEGNFTILVADMRAIEPEKIPALWQEQFLRHWKRHHAGAPAVLDRCRELVRERINVTPNDRAHAYLDKYTWLCGVCREDRVPGAIFWYNQEIREHRPCWLEEVVEWVCGLFGFRTPRRF